MLIDISYGMDNINDLSKKSGMNYAHLTRVINYWVQKGFVQKTNKKYIHSVSLTLAGEKAVEILKKLKKTLESDKHATTNARQTANS